jgi:hypothetical protein
MMITKLYGWLLHLYPRSFYDRFGGEMVEVFTAAWIDTDKKRLHQIAFCTREFAGLLVSISQERWRERSSLRLHKLFRWYLIPFWLFGLSLMLAVIFSLRNWGYVVKPSSIFREMETVDTISLVEFDHDFNPTVLPLRELPYLITPVFPPSQILSHLPSRQPTTQIHPQLAEQITTALADENIDLGRDLYRNHPTEPSFGIGDCMHCMQMGLQRQEDGSFLEIIPLFNSYAQPSGENSGTRVTANEWRYYGYIMPAAYLVTGFAEDDTPLVFVGLASGVMGTDTFHYYEYLFDASETTLTIRAQQDYRFYLSGLEDTNVAVATMLLFVTLLTLTLVLTVFTAIISLIQRQLGRHQPLLQA